MAWKACGEVVFAVDIVKDIGFVLDAFRSTKLPAWLASTVHDVFLAVSDESRGWRDNSAVTGITAPRLYGGQIPFHVE
jgi:3-hydroxyisobutyrate dehydrogenase-like beta-hydroxyacid dehydrogenase